MTEHLNGQIEHIQNGFHSTENEPFLLTNGQTKENNLTVAKNPRKKVSFHDNVTDIDEESSLQNGNHQEKKDEDTPSLDGILNVSEKINYFLTAFAPESQTKGKNSLKPLGHQSSIPEARLAFVTEMVESSLTGNDSRADSVRGDSNLTANMDQEDEGDIGSGREAEHVCQVTDTPDAAGSSESQIVDTLDMAATRVTFMKIFAPQKKVVVEPVVDTSSILEHREEIRDLWEKRMMADDNQSSPSSTVAEKTSTKPSQEEGKEEIVAKINSESETKPDHQMSNGFAKPVDSNDSEENNANHIEEVDTKVHNDEKAHTEEVKAHEEVDERKTKAQENEAQEIQKVDADHDNNNSVDSLEVDNTDDYVEEKTYTSELETSLVMKQPGDATNEVDAHSSKTEEPIPEQPKEKESVMEEPVIATSESDKAEEVEVVAKAEEPIATATTAVEEKASSTEKVTSEIETITQTSEKIEAHEEVITSTSTTDVAQHVEEKSEIVSNENQIKTLEIEQNVNEDDDGFVRVEECLPKVENSEIVEEVTDASKETVESIKTPGEQETPKSIGQEIHSEATAPASTPEPSTDDKPNSPEIEQFVKSGGVKRILPGVQKTEQPYSTCTTETKIAMEIREMREREEELRIMREQSLLSPVVSPVPPKSPLPRSPSPSVKEGSSPTPTGCGYRVSSVFGHKGTTSPSPSVAEEEKKPFKGFSKESTVEKEIRLARDREEELRKQKGLPPREDDSYVKPSQVKSSQVRVFGKMAGTGNNSVKQAATAKIQMEIEEQTQREMALRETGSIRTISQERTDAKVAKLKTSETTPTPATNGQLISNENGHSNGRSSPDVAPYKRGSPSPTGSRPATIFSQTNGKGNISMHKFIASKGKETTFTAPRNGVPKEETAPKAVVPPPVIKLKRNVSVESKIQQEIMEMKQREEELKMLHSNRSSVNSHMDSEDNENEMNQKNNLMEYENGNGNGIHEEDLSPRHNKLIAQWEQRIQKAES